MSDVVNAELLRLCDEILDGIPTSDETLGDIHAQVTVARALKSRLQAEAPAEQFDTFMAIIDNPPPPTQALIDLMRTHGRFAVPQAEVQAAPTTAASVLTRETLLEIFSRYDHADDRINAILNRLTGAPAPAHTTKMKAPDNHTWEGTGGGGHGTTPAPTMPSVNLYTDTTLDKADNLYIELAWQQHSNMPTSERRDRILALFAKGDTNGA